MKYTSFIAIALLVGTGLYSPASAQIGLQFDVPEEPSQSPVEVESETLNVDRETGNAIFTGNVRVTQDEMHLRADRIVVIYDETNDEVTLIEGEGSVVYTSPSEDAESDWVRYDPLTDFMVMGGNVLVLQGSNVLSGDELEIDLNSGEATMVGQVRSVFGKREE